MSYSRAKIHFELAIEHCQKAYRPNDDEGQMMSELVQGLNELTGSIEQDISSIKKELEKI